MRRALAAAAAFLLLGAAALAVTVGTRKPSLDRQWDDDVAVLSGVDLSDPDLVRLTQVRDWTYSSDTVLSRTYFDASFDPRDIVDVWMYEQELGAAGLVAHTFVVFEFTEDYGRGRYLGLSVETRRESGEQYSIVGGMFRKFEVTHIWATEEDLVRRRVEYLDYPLTRYRLTIPQEARERIFVKFARETDGLAHTPAWYNTASNNCTSSLVRYVDQEDPGAIPLHYSWVLTGKMDTYLAELGYLDPGSGLEVTRAYLETNGLRQDAQPMSGGVDP